MEIRQYRELAVEPAARPGPPVVLDLATELGAGTQEVLRVASDGRREAICLWAGRAIADGRAVITHLIVPLFESTAYWLTVPPEERLIIAEFLRSERLLMFADVHTHPEEAFLSPLDRARPFSVRDGFYAGIVPDFAAGEFGQGWRLYEVLAGQWRGVEITDRVIA
jgi:hypothetical protein